MAHSFEELKKKNVAQLREIAAEIEHEAVQGYTQLNKEHLLEAVCKALNIDMHVHHEVVGIDKKNIKSEIRELKKKRDEAITAKNKQELKRVRSRIRILKKTLRKATL
jgi:DNA-binding IclR family transcriptional regulator